MSERTNVLFNINGEPAFLTHEELVLLTDRSLPSHQKAWLEQNGWEFEVSASGRPVVARIYMFMRMSGIAPNTIFNVEKKWQPDMNCF